MTSALKGLVGVCALFLCACASAPQPYCLPPERMPESSSGSLGATVPRSNASSEEYARCKEMEADARLEDQLRKDEVLAKQREAERLEQELREIENQSQQSGDD